jgi:hypothetical protein
MTDVQNAPKVRAFTAISSGVLALLFALDAIALPLRGKFPEFFDQCPNCIMIYAPAHYAPKMPRSFVADDSVIIEAELFVGDVSSVSVPEVVWLHLIASGFEVEPHDPVIAHPLSELGRTIPRWTISPKRAGRHALIFRMLSDREGANPVLNEQIYEVEVTTTLGLSPLTERVLMSLAALIAFAAGLPFLQRVATRRRRAIAKPDE